MSDDDELLGELREMASTVDPPPPRAVRRARKLAPVPEGPRPPMSTNALLLVVRRALYEVGLALADADGNAELAPYDLPVPGSDDDVNTELILAYDRLERVARALSPPSSPPPPPATG